MSVRHVRPIAVGSMVRIIVPQHKGVPGGWGEVKSLDVGILTNYLDDREGTIRVDFPNHKSFNTQLWCLEPVTLDNEYYTSKMNELPIEYRNISMLI